MKVDMIQKTLTFILRFVLLTLLALLLLPAVFFLIKMGQPLSPTEFQGLSYVQYLERQRQVSETAIERYTAGHPDFEYHGFGTPMLVCHSTRAFLTTLVGPLQSLGYTAAALAGMKPDALHPLPQQVSVWNFLPRAWDTFEYLLWYNEIKLDDGVPPAEFCRSRTAVESSAKIQRDDRSAVEMQLQIHPT